MTACSGDDDDVINETPQPQPGQETVVTLTGTLNAKNGGTTRSVVSDGTAAWAANEEIALYYEQANGSHATAKATITSVNGSGVATYSAKLTNPKSGTTVKFVYPYSVHNGSGGYSTTGLFGSQVGTIADLSEKYDIATGDATMTVSGSTATIAQISLANQICICHITLDVSASKFAISDGTNTYTINSDPTRSDYFIAMLPVENATFTFNVTGGDTYTKVKALSAVTNTDTHLVGHIIATDGEVYSVKNDNSATYQMSVSSVTLSAGNLYTSELSFVTVNPVALIAYVGSNTGESGYGFDYGLAIAMTDANGGSPCQWKTSDSNANQGGVDVFTASQSGIANSNTKQSTDGLAHRDDLAYQAYYHTAHDIAFNPTSYGGSVWFLATGHQWIQMIGAYGGFQELRGAFADRGGTNMIAGDYWSCLVNTSETAWFYSFDSGASNYATKTNRKYARAVFAF